MVVVSENMFRHSQEKLENFIFVGLLLNQPTSARWKYSGIRLFILTAGKTSGSAGVSASANGVVRLSASSLALQLLKQRGVFGLYKGFGATAARDVTFSVIYFPLFANLNALVSRQQF